MTPRTKLSAEAVVEALRQHQFPIGEWSVVEQVANSTGYAARRWLDVVAVSLWPSRGIEAHGGEVKVSRNDWRRELDDPEKAEKIAQYLAAFWVAAPAGIVPLEEVPPAWGLIEVDPETRITTVARKPTKRPMPEPTWNFVAAVLRRAGEYSARQALATVPIADLDSRVAEGVKQQLEIAVHHEVTRKLAPLAKELADAQRMNEYYQKRILDFESRSGVKIDEYQARRIGDMVRLLMDADFQLRDVGELARHIQRTRDALTAMLEAHAKVTHLEMPAPAPPERSHK